MKVNNYDIIRKPLVTEKTMKEMADKKYTFIVNKRSDKTKIKKAIEDVFGVTIAEVKTANVKGKPKRVGVHFGKRPDYKKAIVKLTKNSKTIEFFEGM